MALELGVCENERLGAGGGNERGGGGVAGGRGTTLGRATRVLDESEADGWRCGGGGGAERNAPVAAGPKPRDDGAGGMRELGATPPDGRGTTLTGRGTTLTGAGGGAEGSELGPRFALGSFSSPIVVSPLRQDSNPKLRYSRTIS